MSYEKNISELLSNVNLNLEDRQILFKNLVSLFEDFKFKNQRESALLLFEILRDYPDMLNSEDENLLTREFCEYYSLDINKIEEEFNNGEEL